LIAGLLSPGAYEHPVGAIELIETHASWVILTGQFAYKIKKPVDLGFLDFSTLAKRRFYCEEEVRLNRRLAPDIYLGVVPVTGSPEAPRLGHGAAIEYAVKMRQFPPSAQLDQLLDRQELQGRHLDAFAQLIADFHQRVTVAGSGQHYGDPEAVLKPATENFPDLRARLTDPVLAGHVDALENWTNTAFSHLRDDFRQRKRAGFVRECHGDLHLRNLAWVDNRPLAFDCLEFSPDLRWIDVLCEVAFLVMDLQARRQPALAWRFLNQYLEHTGDYAGLPVFPFYLTYRALVRAKIDAIRAGQPDIDDQQKAVAEQECRGYLDLARDYTQPAPPRLILTRGVSASGKTTLTGALLEGLKLIRIRSDVERKRAFGLRADADAHAAFGQGIYSAAASRQTYARLLALAGKVLGAGFSVVIDAAFLRAEQRSPFTALAAARGIDCTILEITAPPATLRERIASRARGASDADIDILERQLASWEPLTTDEARYALPVNAGPPVDTAELMNRIRTLQQTRPR